MEGLEAAMEASEAADGAVEAQGQAGSTGPEGPTGTFSGTSDSPVTFNDGETVNDGMTVNGADGGVTINGDLTINAGDAGVTINGPVSAPGLLPPGMVVAFAGSDVPDAGASVPDGWLLCDGRAVSRTQYPALFAAIGITHGGGDGVNTFNLPDYRGRFLRGVDDGAGRDPDAASRSAPQPDGGFGAGATGDAVGSVEGDAFRLHAHEINDPGHVHDIHDPGHSHGAPSGDFVTTASTGYDYRYFYQQNFYTGTTPTTAAATTGITINSATTGVTVLPTGGGETRPVNANVNWIIKY